LIISEKEVGVLESNVIAFPGLIEEPPKDIVLDFMGDLTDWAEKHGVDIKSQQYKYNAAMIMTGLQSMLLEAKK
jgi:hypothetical protein